jgi:hypothetical protein
MVMWKANDQSAFPCIPPLGPDELPASGYPYVSDGMTLRDYFAAKSMQSAMMGVNLIDSLPSELAQIAYQMADAMLAERAK